ncbi:major facilitator superfamily domain-containing protein [Halenospora varia]|nr:major facilitator superfamily domain-containing protein [Halenospora varia]
MGGHHSYTSLKGTDITKFSVSENVDEVAPLLNNEILSTTPRNAKTDAYLYTGVFISQADTSLVLATYGQISSQFGDLESGSWLLSSYMLTMCVTQPLYGKLSDIYSRKRSLLASYLLFALGTAASRLGQNLPQIIAARAIQGVGGASIVCLCSILLTDLVPLHKVATYCSYLNIAQTVGRSCGGSIGGWLTQTIGWRWSFLGQCPISLVAIVLMEWKLQLVTIVREDRDTTETSHWQKLKRIDFVGAFFLSSTILTTLLVLDMGGQKLAWTHPIIIACACTAVISTILFALAEKHWAKEPIFPLSLLTHCVVITSYSILTLWNIAQTALMMIVPMYFQVFKNASLAASGAYLIPAIIGNTIGGLATGAWIQNISSMLSFTLLILVWRGHTTILESLLIFPAGLATGIAHSAVFIGLTSGVQEHEVAIAGSRLYLCGNIVGVIGVSAGNALHQVVLRNDLIVALAGREDKKEIMQKALSDIHFIQNASKAIRSLLLPAYLDGFRHIFGEA